jgi:uncharacterized membrane protein YhaH (DUF805 family)
MKNMSDYYSYAHVITNLMTYILAIVLIISVKNNIGKGWKWLLAFSIIVLFSSFCYSIIPLFKQNYDITRKFYDILYYFPLLSTACFGFFLFSAWSSSRMKMNIRDFLFSFSGRIPRSVFWVSLLILFPLGIMVGFVPYISESQGFVKILIWIIYFAFLIPSVWISLAIYTKRWHDCSISGWMTLVLLIPVIGLFWFFGYLGFVRGTEGPNQYGDDPFEVKQSE